jgi:actin-like ATPase involved in cell morphogenesis
MADAILLVGGGSLAQGAGEAFAEEFGLPVVVGNEPRYSNAAGFLEHAVRKYEGMMQHAEGAR